MTREPGSDQLVWRHGARTDQEAEHARTVPSLELEQLFECEGVMRYLAKSHVFFAKKVGISSDLANCLADLLKMRDFVRSVEKRTVADLQTIDYSNQRSEAPFILLIDSSALEGNIDESVQSALDLSESTGAVVWLVSFLSLIDRRILARFNCFFAFSSSPTELDVLSDVLPVPKRAIEDLTWAHDALFFFTEQPVEDKKGARLANPCLVKLPREISTGIEPWPRVVAVDQLYPALPSGRLSYYYARDHIPLLRYQFENRTLRIHTARYTCQLEGHSAKSTETVKLPPGATRSRPQSPSFDYEISKIEESHHAKLHVEIVFFRDREQSAPIALDLDIELLPWNTLRWAVPKDITGKHFEDLTRHIAAFVTPRAEEVEDVYQRAKALAVNLEDYAWSPDVHYEDREAILPKIEAIYNALRERQLQWDARPVVNGPDDIWGYQEVRLPRQTLAKGGGNCVDLTVLFASVLERAHIPPLIVVKQRHVFVGWKVKLTPAQKDGKDFLEAIYVTRGSPEFEEAHKAGRERCKELKHNNWLQKELYDERGYARIIDIEAERHKEEKAILPLEP